MIYNHYEIQDLTLKDFQEQIGKSVTITFLKPQKLKSYDELKNELSGVVKKIGLSANSPHLPVDLTIKDLESDNEYDINLFKMESLEI
ncbi:hypothetical protein [Lutibacter sp. B1]|uniref:hypothetical protein n=1 Tax=Lutibacter sp. B1 TaxID=2725996 RepID=UPI00145683AA|nr:hypothetical protein [Lutibacter sp. B1]NLP59332.1 hypothetical protein [Lutibacter sp. B1]